MLKLVTSLAALFVLAFLSAVPASAHGGVAVADDICVMQIGPYVMHFTGYQPLQAQSQEFCEDIPYEGKAIIVLDEVDTKMREMPVEFRVLKDVKNIGVTAKLEQLGSKEEIEAATVHVSPFKVYALGSLNFELEFEKGHYIGLLTLKDDATNNTYYSVFPFSVGYGLPLGWLYYVGFALAALVVVAVAYHIFNRRPVATA